MTTGAVAATLASGGVRRRPTTRAEWVTDAAEFAALGARWNDLLRASAADGPFLTWEWLHSWHLHCAAGSRLQILCAYADDELIGAAPFRRTRAAVGCPARLEFLGTGFAGSDYLDVVVRRGREPQALDALVASIEKANVSLRLDHVPEISLSARIADRLSNHGWTRTICAGGVCPSVPLAGHTWDSYLATLGSSHRANVRRRQRALDRAFEVRFDQVDKDADRREALSVLWRLHDRRFATSGGSTAFSDISLRRFHDDVTRRALDAGWLRMYVLRLDGDAAAVMYGFLYDRRFYFYQHGFDDRYRDFSVGVVLMAATIRAAIQERAEAFDLLWGDEPYKALWACDMARLRQIHLFPPTVGGRLQRLAVSARRGLADLARRVRPSGDTRAA